MNRERERERERERAKPASNFKGDEDEGTTERVKDLALPLREGERKDRGSLIRRGVGVFRKQEVDGRARILKS